MYNSELTDNEFSRFQRLLYSEAGISLSENKKTLVTSRLSKRLVEYNLSNYGEYLTIIEGNQSPNEKQIAINLLTTNETYFFREPKHFEFLQKQARSLCLNGSTFRVWSAACSNGQEPYSIAMVLEDILGNRPWEIIASDISTRVLEHAVQGLYPIEQAQNIPEFYLKNYCLRGVEEQDGTMLIDQVLTKKIEFIHINLNNPLPRMKEFDIIFLRNVMIYFDKEIKTQVVKNMQTMLKPGGYLLIGHSETLNGIDCEFKAVAPAIYQKPAYQRRD